MVDKGASEYRPDLGEKARARSRGIGTLVRCTLTPGYNSPPWRSTGTCQTDLLAFDGAMSRESRHDNRVMFAPRSTARDRLGYRRRSLVCCKPRGDSDGDRRGDFRPRGGSSHHHQCPASSTGWSLEIDCCGDDRQEVISGAETTDAAGEDHHYTRGPAERVG